MARPAEDAPSDDEVAEVVEVADAAEPDVTEEISTDEVEEPAEGVDEPTVEVEQVTDVVATDPTAETPTRATSRRRLLWRRTKPAPAVPDEPVTEVVETASGATDVVETEVVEPETTAAEPDSTVAEEAVADADGEAESDADEPVADEPAPVLVPHRTAPKGLKIATAVAAALVIGAAGFAAAMLQPYLVERANVQIKQRVAETAAAAITTLWSYTPEDIDTLGDRTSGYLGGDFAAQYRDFIDSIVEANKQAQVTNQTQVVGAAVESLTPTEATAIVYTNSVSTTPNSQGFQSMRYVSYRLTLENRDRKWLVTKMNGITSLDLAPRL